MDQPCDGRRAREAKGYLRAECGGIILVGQIMAAGTLLVLDANLPGGLIEGFGDMRYAHTLAFTTIAWLFSNKWLWRAVLLSLLLQEAVIHVPFLQQAFSTASLSPGD